MVPAKNDQGNLVDRTVPLPQNWNDLLAIPSNKQDLALLLSNELIAQAPGDKIIGGFRTAEDTQCTQPLVYIEMLRANHEKADTRVVLNCIHAETEDVVVAARDTDILLSTTSCLLLQHEGQTVVDEDRHVQAEEVLSHP